MEKTWYKLETLKNKITRLKRLLVIDRDMYSSKTKKDFASLDFRFANAAQLYLRRRCSALLTLLSIAYAAQHCLRCSAKRSNTQHCARLLSNAQQCSARLKFSPRRPTPTTAICEANRGQKIGKKL